MILTKVSGASRFYEKDLAALPEIKKWATESDGVKTQQSVNEQELFHAQKEQSMGDSVGFSPVLTSQERRRR